MAALGDQSIGVDADVSKVEDLERLVKSAVDAFGRLDIMVNNAGIETRTSILDTTEAQYEKVMEINLKSAFFGTQLAAKQMIAQGERRPDHQHHVRPRGLADAGQHAVLPLQGRDAHAHPHRRGRARAARRHRRRCRARGGRHPDQHRRRWTTRRRWRHSTPPSRSGGWPQPDEIGSVVAFLAGDGASYLTATTVFADGGIMHSSPGL